MLLITVLLLTHSAVDGFGGDVHSDLMLRPDPSTLSVLPWRPEHGRVVRMFCDVLYPDGTQFECDVRSMLRKAEDMAKKEWDFVCIWK